MAYASFYLGIGAKYSVNSAGKIKGLYTEYYPITGVKRIECNYVDGVRQGTFTIFHPNGVKQVVCEFINGLIEGKQLMYSLEGALTTESEFVNGFEKVVTKFYSDGVKSSRCENLDMFYKNIIEYTWSRYGYLLTCDKYKGDEFYVKERYFPDGAVSHVERFSKGLVKELVFEKYFASGIRESSSEYVNNEMVHDLLWDSNGVVLYEYKYDNVRGPQIIKYNDEKGRNCLIQQHGEVIVWKACKAGKGKFVFVQLLVPSEAKRVTPIPTSQQYKSRVEYAKVVKIIDELGVEYSEAESFVFTGDKQLTYKLGKIVLPTYYDGSIYNDCGPGINVHLEQEHCLYWKYLL
ncbi:MAG: pentapeptide repeat-containing protein [Harvfovirus sp.]|uniref:Pentapeptide repeat-containing protein n=1 Tax=Harvfovirus sp. TaxID=2487768 RepID=A0A3G5A413_9VIRU|nr:MAG: pentapeptide repeat-containing protein [Harvfovirus sp.]